MQSLGWEISSEMASSKLSGFWLMFQPERKFVLEMSDYWEEWEAAIEMSITLSILDTTEAMPSKREIRKTSERPR